MTTPPPPLSPLHSKQGSPTAAPSAGRSSRRTRGHVGTGLVLLTLVFASLLTLAPFAYLTTSSFKDNEHFFASLLLPLRSQAVPADASKVAPSPESAASIPAAASAVKPLEGVPVLGAVAWEDMTTKNFGRLIRDEGFARSLVNSVFISTTTALVATLFCAMGGYALAKYKFRGRGLVTALVLGAILIPGPLLLAPTYELLYRMSLLDTFAGLIVPALAPAFGVFLFRQAVMSSVPTELMEAARIDGCSEARTFAVVALPLLRPMAATFIMITVIGVWNNFITPQVVMQSPEKFPLSVAVAQLRGVYYQDYGLQMAGTLLAILPPLVLFIVLQKDFVSGLTAGAVKG